jgi:N-ethylmaleimide reductase
MNLAYIHIVDQRVAFGAPDFTLNIKKIIKENFKGTVISGGDVNTQEKAETILESGLDLVYVGRPFISNPDLVERLQHTLELTAPDVDTFYSPGEKGYTDYPFSTAKVS